MSLCKQTASAGIHINTCWLASVVAFVRRSTSTATQGDPGDMLRGSLRAGRAPYSSVTVEVTQWGGWIPHTPMSTPTDREKDPGAVNLACSTAPGTRAVSDLGTPQHWLRPLTAPSLPSGETRRGQVSEGREGVGLSVPSSQRKIKLCVGVWEGSQSGLGLPREQIMNNANM